MLEAVNIFKSYGKGCTEVSVLKGLDFAYHGKEIVGVYGPSGSGKSTFLHILGGIDKPDKGKVLFDGSDIYAYDDKKLSAFRNKTVGFVFQLYHLLPEFSALENVMMPPLISGIKQKEAREMALSAIEKVGLLERIHHKPSELSGGEQQRIAIARAIVMFPKILLADEPTGNLDKKTGIEIIEVLKELNTKYGVGIIMVTHDQSLINDMDRKMELCDGRLNEI